MRFGSNTPRLETERLILRRFERQDADALFRILSDEEVNRFLPWFPHKSREETSEFLENSVLPIIGKRSRTATRSFRAGKIRRSAICPCRG